MSIISKPKPVTTVVIPGYTLRQFRQEILNLYYGRDPVALNNLLDSLKEVNHADPKD